MKVLHRTIDIDFESEEKFLEEKLDIIANGWKEVWKLVDSDGTVLAQFKKITPDGDYPHELKK